MRVTGIIAEYNPFHNGHKYQIEQAKKECDAVVVVMSGSFVQRGDIAVFDKWTRTKMALENGADLVVELPVCYTLASAERFAYGAVALLDSLGVVDKLCFGSECGDVEALEKAAQIIVNEPPEVSEKIQILMKKGMSYPRAREKAYENYIPSTILSEPNNILAVEYIKALIKTNSIIKPVTVKRYMAGHHSEDVQDGFASATKIRAMLKDKEEIGDFVPWSDMADIYDITRLDAAMTVLLRTMSVQQLKALGDVSEGLENRIIAAARECDRISAIAEKVKTKRYTMTRIYRILLSALLGIDGSMSMQEPEYIRVLGMNNIGREILAKAKKKARLPIITKAADFDRENEMFKKDVLATDISALCSENPSERYAGRDFIKSPVNLI